MPLLSPRVSDARRRVTAATVNACIVVAVVAAVAFAAAAYAPWTWLQGASAQPSLPATIGGVHGSAAGARSVLPAALTPTSRTHSPTSPRGACPNARRLPSGPAFPVTVVSDNMVEPFDDYNDYDSPYDPRRYNTFVKIRMGSTEAGQVLGACVIADEAIVFAFQTVFSFTPPTTATYVVSLASERVWIASLGLVVVDDSCRVSIACDEGVAESSTHGDIDYQDHQPTVYVALTANVPVTIVVGSWLDPAYLSRYAQYQGVFELTIDHKKCDADDRIMLASSISSLPLRVRVDPSTTNAYSAFVEPKDCTGGARTQYQSFFTFTPPVSGVYVFSTYGPLTRSAKADTVLMMATEDCARVLACNDNDLSFDFTGPEWEASHSSTLVAPLLANVPIVIATSLLSVRSSKIPLGLAPYDLYADLLYPTDFVDTSSKAAHACPTHHAKLISSVSLTAPSGVWSIIGNFSDTIPAGVVRGACSEGPLSFQLAYTLKPLVSAWYRMSVSSVSALSRPDEASTDVGLYRGPSLQLMDALCRSAFSCVEAAGARRAFSRWLIAGTTYELLVSSEGEELVNPGLFALSVSRDTPHGSRACGATSLPLTLGVVRFISMRRLQRR